MNKVNCELGSLPERLSAAEVLRLFGGITRPTLTRWMQEEEAAKRGFTRPFPRGAGEAGSAKVWSGAEVQKWSVENARALSNAAAADTKRTVLLPLERAIRAVEVATDGATSSKSFAARIEQALLKALKTDPQIGPSLKAVRIKGSEFEFEFDDASASPVVHFLLRYR